MINKSTNSKEVHAKTFSLYTTNEILTIICFDSKYIYINVESTFEESILFWSIVNHMI